jgi:putative transposase
MYLAIRQRDGVKVPHDTGKQASMPVSPVLSDEAWARMAPYMTGDGRGRGARARDNRMFVEAVLWKARTGAAWRRLPERFGAWNSTFRRFKRWSYKGMWHHIFEVMANDPCFEYRIKNNAIICEAQSALESPVGLRRLKLPAAPA